MRFINTKLTFTFLALSAALLPSEGFAAGAVMALTSGVQSQSTGAPTGPLQSRLPLVSPDVVAVGGDPKHRGAVPPGHSTSDQTSRAYGNGTERWPYSMARVASTSANVGAAIANNPTSSKPFRFTGKMIMRFGASSWSQCTGSLILPNVVVTAAHCVHDYGLGQAGFANEVRWIPANTGDPFSSAPGPFGVWYADALVVPDVYYNGTDTCETGAEGAVCNNDIALIVLRPLGGRKASAVLGGTYAYKANGFSYVTSPAFGNEYVADITQLGYPKAFDLGRQMERNNSMGKFTVTTDTTTGQPLLNTQIGTAMTGGASGGPWLVNFGTRPAVGAGASLGAQSLSNVVVGVTSWGYTDVGYNVQGASFFGQNAEYPAAAYGTRGPGNIGYLVNYVCTAKPAACQP